MLRPRENRVWKFIEYVCIETLFQWNILFKIYFLENGALNKKTLFHTFRSFFLHVKYPRVDYSHLSSRKLT